MYLHELDIFLVFIYIKLIVNLMAVKIRFLNLLTLNKSYFHCWMILCFYPNNTCNMLFFHLLAFAYDFPSAWNVIDPVLCVANSLPYKDSGHLPVPLRSFPWVAQEEPANGTPSAFILQTVHPSIVLLMQVLDIFMHLHLPVHHKLLKVFSFYWSCVLTTFHLLP